MLTKRRLLRSGVPFVECDLESSPDQVERFVAAGLTSAPVVEAGDVRWAGYRPEMIDSLADQVTAA